MKSVNVLSKLGALSFMGLMVLTLATGGTALAADNFKLFQQVKVSEKPVELKRIEAVKDGVANAEKWLFMGVESPEGGTKGKGAEGAKLFVASFANEPFQFAEGIKAGMLKAIKEGKLDRFRAEAEIGFDQVSSKEFGGFIRMNALKDLLAKILKMDKSKLEDEKFLEELFSDPAIRAALGLTEEKAEPSASPSPVITEEPSAKPTPDTSAKDKEIEAAKKLAAEQAARNAQLQAALQAMQQQRLGTGEVNDAGLEKAAQQICDRFNAAQAALDSNKNLLNDQLNGVNELFNRFAATSRIGDVARNENKDRLEDILPGLLQNALGQNQQQQVAPPPPAPVTPPLAANEPRNDNNGLFDQPLPRKPEAPVEEPLPPLQLPVQSSNAVQQPINLNLPSQTGGRELREGETQISKTNPETRTSALATLGQNPGLTDLVMAKARVQGELRTAQGSITAMKERAARLDEQLENELKGGGRDALPEWVKRKEQELQAKSDKAKKALESVQQGAQFAKTQEAQQAVQAQFQALSGQSNAADEELAKFKAEVESKVQEGNKKIKALAKRRDDLLAAASKLEGQLGGLKEEETAMQTMINNNMQMQLAAIQGGGQQTAAPNVNRIQSGGAGKPRSVVPQRLGATGGVDLQSGNTSVPASGKRGPLGSK